MSEESDPTKPPGLVGSGADLALDLLPVTLAGLLPNAACSRSVTEALYATAATYVVHPLEPEGCSYCALEPTT